MEIALVVARAVLAVVFAVAALAKLSDRAGSRQAVVGFGVPDTLATPLSIALPLAELAVAAALLPTASAWWGAVGALALLLLFVTAIAVNLASGRKPDCRCFGQLSAGPIGWSTLARNAVLAAIAGLVVVGGWQDAGPSAVAWLADRSAVELAGLAGLALVVGILATATMLLLNLVRQNGRLLLRLEALEARLDAAGIAPAPEQISAASEAGLSVGAPAPAFQLSGLHGETLTLDALRAVDKPILLIFSDPDCGPCNALLPEIGVWQRDHSPDLMISVISRGSLDANRAKSSEHGLFNVLVQEDREVGDAYGADGTPSAVIVNPDGTVASALAEGPERIRALVARMVSRGAQPSPAAQPSTATPQAAGAPTAAAAAMAGASPNGGGDPALVAATARAGPTVGERTPALKLQDLGGKKVDFRRLRGRKTLVLFWDPQCGFCQQMLEDLKAWETEPPKGAPKLLVVSTGTREENQAMGLRSPIVLDPSFNAGLAFGAGGTPSAVLIDAKGKIASEVAAGTEAVLALAGARRQSPESATPQEIAKVGDPAPPFRLPDLEGKTVDLAASLGSRSMLLFWNPACGFCQQMLDDLKAWEADPPEEAPKLLVVSTGSVEANDALGLRSPVLLDQDFSVASTFGANGTPMAVLVDAEGRIASEVASGAQAVLELARAQGQPASRRP
jgi:peroxiredoxin